MLSSVQLHFSERNPEIAIYLEKYPNASYKHNITKYSVFIVIFSIQFSSVEPLPRFSQDSLYLKQLSFLDRWLLVAHATGLKGMIYLSVLEFLSVPSHTFMGKNSLISFFFVEYFSNH